MFINQNQKIMLPKKTKFQIFLPKKKKKENTKKKGGGSRSFG